MTSLTWTKNELSQAFAGCLTLRDIITKLEVDMSAQGKVICEIRINDLSLSEEDEIKFADCSAKDLFSLAIQVTRPRDLVRDALKSAVGLMPQLEKSALTTAELLRAGEAARAARGFEETVSGCHWLVETLLHVRGASKANGLAIIEIDQWLASETLIGRVVTEVSEAHSRADSILVADLLEYEMTAALAKWKTTIESELDRRLGDEHP